MVKEYLENTREELLQKRVNALDSKKSLENHLKENMKFIQLLEESHDPNYAAFTPREVNSRNLQQIKELQEEQKTITNDLENVQREISDLDHQIDEINSVIKVAREAADSSSGDEDSYSADFKFRILETQERERQRISRDLHDSTVQNLTSLLHKTELCSKLLDVDPVRCRLELSSLSKILRDVIEDTRNMIYDLHPMSFDDIDFDVTVERYLDKLKNNSTIDFSYKVEGIPYPIQNVVALTLLRVIQEACNNSMKYANAQKVSVKLYYMENKLVLSIQDDGIGFDPSAISQTSSDDHSGFGLPMMKERVYLLSGTIDIQSEKGKGCTILVEIPRNEEV